MDVDLVVQFRADNIVAAFHALAGLGYRPLVPVTAETFSDKARRERWIEEKGMQVLNFFSDHHESTSVDVFVTEPFDFDTDTTMPQGRSRTRTSGAFRFDPDAIRMKEAAGRPRDLDEHPAPALDPRGKKMSRTDNDIDWSLTSWEGSRRAQLRRWLALTVRERFQAIDEMTEVARRIGAIGTRRGYTGRAGNPPHVSGAGNDAGLPEGPEDVPLTGGYAE